MPRRPKDEELERNALLAAEFMNNWRGPGRIHPHVVAHRNPDTRQLTFVVRMLPEQLPHIWAVCAAPAVVPDNEEQAADMFVKEWEGPEDPELPTVYVDRAPLLLSYVARFTPAQFVYLKAMVEHS